MGEYYKIITEEDHLEHHGVKGMKWGVRKQEERKQFMLKAAKTAYEVSKGHAGNVKYYSNNKNRTGDSTKSDMKRWAKASKNAANYYAKKAEEFRNMSTNKISRKDIKRVKKWLKNNSTIEDAEYTDVYYNNRYYNYLNNLDNLDKPRHKR